MRRKMNESEKNILKIKVKVGKQEKTIWCQLKYTFIDSSVMDLFKYSMMLVEKFISSLIKT